MLCSNYIKKADRCDWSCLPSDSCFDVLVLDSKLFFVTIFFIKLQITIICLSSVSMKERLKWKLLLCPVSILELCWKFCMFPFVLWPLHSHICWLFLDLHLSVSASHCFYGVIHVSANASSCSNILYVLIVEGYAVFNPLGILYHVSHCSFLCSRNIASR